MANTVNDRGYDWGGDKKTNTRRRDPLEQLREERSSQGTSVNPTSVPLQTVDIPVPHHVNFDDPFGTTKNAFPGVFRFHKMPDDTTIDVMVTPEGIGKWDQILYYMYKRPIIPISAIGVLGSFASSIVSLVAKHPSKTTHFWANMTVGFKVFLIGGVVYHAYYPPKFKPIFKHEYHTDLKE